MRLFQGRIVGSESVALSPTGRLTMLDKYGYMHHSVDGTGRGYGQGLWVMGLGRDVSQMENTQLGHWLRYFPPKKVNCKRSASGPSLTAATHQATDVEVWPLDGPKVTF